MIFGKKEEIDLIPEEQQELKFKKNLFVFPIIFFLIFILELVFFAAVFILKTKEESKDRILQDSITEKNQEWQKVASRAAELKSIKQNLANYKTFNSHYPPIENYLKKIA